MARWLSIQPLSEYKIEMFYHSGKNWLYNAFKKIGTTYLYLSALKNFRLLITIFAVIFMA